MASELPVSVSDYITKELGRDITEVVAHRYVNGTEPKYAVLMKNPDETLFTVLFVGQYTARRELGPYEEAYDANAVLDIWDCFSDGDEWEYSVAKFKKADASFF